MGVELGFHRWEWWVVLVVLVFARRGWWEWSFCPSRTQDGPKAKLLVPGGLCLTAIGKLITIARKASHILKRRSKYFSTGACDFNDSCELKRESFKYYWDMRISILLEPE